MIAKILLTLVYIHQTIDVIGIKGYVDRPGKVSTDTIGWLLLTVLYITYILGIPVIPYILIVIIGLVLFAAYYFHWRYFFFKVSEKKVKSYNEYFRGNHRLMPESNTKCVPDTFHIVHTILYLLVFMGLLFEVI